MSDTRTDKEVYDSLRKNLMEQKFPPDLVDRAIDCWISLLEASPALEAEATNAPNGHLMQYCFLQGVVAGNMISNHQN